MAQHDLDHRFMKEAIDWANDCAPKRENIPKVGAIIAASGLVIGRGRRGNGQEGDDEHAEWKAFNDIPDKAKVAGATLYTTLEPCTMEVRKKPLECCTELIIQHQIRKVMVGILDPNQGVTGKGLLRLQEAGIEVAFFPHDLSKEIRAINTSFIRSQQTLSATILSPKKDEELRTYDTHGTHTVRFKCNNPPGPNTYLLLYSGGLFWPQPGPFRKVEQGIWEITAHFGSTGDYTLQLVNAGDLGNTLVRFYRKATQQNRERRERLREKFRGEFDLSILGGDFPGIEMNGLPKGFQEEASVNVRVFPKMSLLEASVTTKTFARGTSLTISYEIECSDNVSNEIWLGASFRDADGTLFSNTGEDKAVSITKGKSTYERKFTIPRDAPSGQHSLNVSLWRGIVGSSEKSKWIAGMPIEIKIT